MKFNAVCLLTLVFLNLSGCNSTGKAPDLNGSMQPSQVESDQAKLQKATTF